MDRDAESRAVHDADALRPEQEHEGKDSEVEQPGTEPADTTPAARDDLDTSGDDVVV
jgi:hypothetical protein